MELPWILSFCCSFWTFPSRPYKDLPFGGVFRQVSLTEASN